MNAVAVNLSRKWRSQDFDQLVGQDLAVRILKNSLYLGHYFPVYLFAGQRGCGKTSTARIFAAAVNCQALLAFQKDPKKMSLPCLTCESCIAMRDGNHPDFIEIDAASHTGVDNIRTVIESSSLLPVIGRKRIYLIDEAHMLSKAAFNAALKILEEPPSTALFILATTNPHKIIDTVRSRCFQLFFTPIAHDQLASHLQMICKKEKIMYTDDALDLIVRHTEGSARDALNLLEQVRFSASVVNKEAVLAVLGYIDDQQVMDLILLTMQGQAPELVGLLHSLNIDRHRAEFIWQRMVVLLRGMLWCKYGVLSHELGVSVKMLENSARLCSSVKVHQMVEALYRHEELFLKTAMQHIFLEMMLLDLCCKDKKKIDDDNSSAPCVVGAVAYAGENSSADSDEEEIDDIDDQGKTVNYGDQWQQFVAKVGTCDDQLIHSLFKQARFIGYVPETFKVSVELSKDFTLFKEWLENTQEAWQPLLREFFPTGAVLDTQFTGTQKVEISKKIKADDMVLVSKPLMSVQPREKFTHPVRKSGQSGYAQKIDKTVPAGKSGLLVDVSDENRWKNASMLLRHIPGIITEMREN